MSAPPPPPPPCAPPPPKLSSKKVPNNSSKPVDRGLLLGEIHKGAKLRKAVTNDRSAPTVGNKKASPASKYNTIGVHTHRQQQHQVKDSALWRRGSQDGKKSNDSSPRGGGGFTPNKIGGMAGELFPGGIPKLQNKGQKQRIPGGSSSPKPVRLPNGPTNQTDFRSQINKNVSNGGSVINDNKTLPQRNIPPNRKYQPPMPHPVNTSNDINSNITNNNHSVNVNTTPSPSQHTAGGIALNMGGGRRMPGSHPPPPPPPPPGRPPSLPNNRTPNKNRPSSMIGRPLPPPPTLSASSSSSSSSSSLNRAQPPPPPPPTRGPPLPPDRIASSSGTLPRSKPPAQRPPPPPPTRPPAGPSRVMSQNQEGPSPPQRTASSLSSSSNYSIDITKRGHFHDVYEFPPPEPFNDCPKTYPSRGSRNAAGSRRAPPPPPPHPISAVR